MKVNKLEPQKVSFDENSLYIEWKDQHISRWGLPNLRKNCPCASCRGKKIGKTDIISPEVQKTRIQSCQLLGAYALQIKWEDGHDTGIYTYLNLKKNCECDLCVK